MKKAFLVGIGGIGVSALAQYLYAEGYEISGSDGKQTDQTDFLEKNIYAKIFYNHQEENISDDTDLLVYSPAIPEKNPEREKARKLSIQQYSYPEFLGKISEQKKTIAVAGTNGKTTTTAMIATILDDAGFDPTVIVGGVMPRFNSNCHIGQGEWFVVEACEYKDSFLSIKPDIVIITNISYDHSDYFKSQKTYLKTFYNFLKNIKEDGLLVVNSSDENIKKIIKDFGNLEIVNYQKYIKNNWNLPIPGNYNRENASASLAVSEILNIDNAQHILENKFQTSKRRFEFIGKTGAGAIIYDDYAHNYQALDLLLQAVLEKHPDKELVLVFGPHLYSRTEQMFDELVWVLKKVKNLFLLPIYPARENPGDFNISSDKLIQEIGNGKVLNNVNVAVSELENYDERYVILNAGAGDSHKVSKKLLDL